jgi:hypothetical protein
VPRRYKKRLNLITVASEQVEMCIFLARPWAAINEVRKT